MGVNLEKIQVLVKITKRDVLTALLGVFDENLELIMRETDVNAVVKEEGILLNGESENVVLCEKVITKLSELISLGETVDKSRIIYCIDIARSGSIEGIEKVMSGVVAVTSRGKQIKCKTFGQKKYVEAIKNNSIVFGVGPAGTGKTYLAVALAVQSYKTKEVEKIILTRPAVEAGEKLGFLPGDLQNKVDPYLRPLYDALQEMFGLETYQKLIERGVIETAPLSYQSHDKKSDIVNKRGYIEIAPLAYMRGRTLSDAFIILDEAQNTTKEQMKMFLTRMGQGSKMVITGDATQIDLPMGKQSGLKHAVKILSNVEGVEVVNLTHKDVVRNPLVAEIIKAYSKDEKSKVED